MSVIPCEQNQHNFSRVQILEYAEILKNGSA